ncbi:MAG: rod shape-determining protein MreD [Acidobacteriia bacterium]|nr:rod shape-determining protein MreD [Terriglobia bacterium]
MRFSLVVVALFILVAVFVQAKLPLWIPFLSRLDLPLIVVIYFGLAQRQPTHGLVIGMITGLLQDGLSHGALGMNGLTKMLVGFLASSISGRVEVDYPVIRIAALLAFSVLNLLIFMLLEKLFFAARFSWAHYHLIDSPVLNAVVGFPIFVLADRYFRRD